MSLFGVRIQANRCFLRASDCALQVDLFGLFLVDKEGTVRHALVNDLPLGRNVDEALRMVDALTFFEENGEVCPANWVKGSAGMKATHEGVADYLASN